MVLPVAAMYVLSVTACASSADPPRGSGSITAGGIRFSAITRGPPARPGQLTVLFLHGASFTSRIWEDTGLLDRVARSGSRAVAVDLPGYGRTPDTKRDKAEVLTALIRRVGAPEDVVVVSPSMSGEYSLAMLAQRPKVRLAGFVPVAPVVTGQFHRPPGAPSIPTMAVWGADDDVVPVSGAAALRRELPGARLVVLPDAGHAAYKDQPAKFGTTLLRFIGTVRHQQ